MFDVAGRAWVAGRSVEPRKGVRRFLSDGNNGSVHFDDRRPSLVGDQLAQEWNQHDEQS